MNERTRSGASQAPALTYSTHFETSTCLAGDLRGPANQPANLMLHSLLFLFEDLLISLSVLNGAFVRVLFVVAPNGYYRLTNNYKQV